MISFEQNWCLIVIHVSDAISRNSTYAYAWPLSLVFHHFQIGSPSNACNLFRFLFAMRWILLLYYDICLIAVLGARLQSRFLIAIVNLSDHNSIASIL